MGTAPHAAGVALLAALGCAAGRTTSQAPDGAQLVPAAAVARPTPPEGYVAVSVLTVIPGSDGAHTVVLVDGEREWALPIAIGEAEARAIQLRLDGMRFPRPLTHDLLDKVVSALGGGIEKVHVDELRGGTFYGTLFVRQGERLLEIDARPSDAIALALGAGVPIFASRQTLAAGGFPAGDLGPDRRLPRPRPSRPHPVSDPI